MRAALPGLTSPHPIGAQLPWVLQEDDFAMRFVRALDDVIAPLFWTLDGFAAYLDPSLAPADFVQWLASWVGVTLDESWPEERQRDLLTRAVDLYRRRGTARGLAEEIAIYAGVEPEISENGASASSDVPGGAIPGHPTPELVVRIRVPKPDSVDVARIEAIVRSSKPAHVPHRVEVAKA